MNHHESHNSQVEQAVKDNLVSTFVLNYFDDLDKKIEEPAVQVLRLHNSMRKHNLGSAAEMDPECYKDVCTVLRSEGLTLDIKPDEEALAKLIQSFGAMSQLKNTNFFQSTVKPAPEKPKFVKFYPEASVLGIPMEEYAVTKQLIKNRVGDSMIQGSMGMYMKVGGS
jgi:hypothetical protein